MLLVGSERIEVGETKREGVNFTKERGQVEFRDRKGQKWLLLETN